MMANFIDLDRKKAYELPLSVDDWLNEDHLARFVVEVIDQMDLSKLTNQYAGKGSKAYHPKTLLAILVYGYATGVFSSRRLESACFDSVAFRFIAANTQPDHDTLALFRRRFLGELSDVFVQVLEMATEMKLLKLGTVCLDGTKIHADASRHKALSHGHIDKLEGRLGDQVKELLALAEQADAANVPDGMKLPEEIKRREARLQAMATAKGKIQARAQERYEREKAQYEEKMARRVAKEKQTGKKPSGKPPEPPAPGVRPTDQVNLTDEESRIMPVAGGGFDQAYNAQAGVDAPTMLVVVAHVTQAPNDREQIKPTLAVLQAQSATSRVLGDVHTLIADSGYCSQASIEACQAVGIEPLIAVARQDHHPDWRDRHSEPPALAPQATLVQAMAHKLKTKAGRATYALRKQVVEPVFGIIKSVLGFRKFSLRGLDKVSGEWTLVCLAWNVKRLAVLRSAPA